MNIKDKLTPEQQDHILGKLFGFTVIEDGVILDDHDQEFHQDPNNDCYDLTTLEGIFFYHKELWRETGTKEAMAKQ